MAQLMTPNIKVAAITLLAIALAMATAWFLQPSSAEHMAQYKAAHAELAGRDDLTPEESERLESLFRKINAKENVKGDIQEILIRNVIAALALAAIALVIGRVAKLGANHVFAAGGLVFACFIIAQAPAFGAITATTFVITALVSIKRPPPETPPAPSS